MRLRAAAAVALMLVPVVSLAQQPVPPSRPAPVDTTRLDGLRRMIRAPLDTARRAPADSAREADTTRQADTARPAVATASRQRAVRPVTPVRPVSRVDSRADSLRARSVGTDGVYDVVLDVPNVSVDEIVLQVDGVRAHVSLDARVAKLVQLSVGADVGIERVHLGIRGVQAEAHLKVDLDNVAIIVDRVLTTIDRNPEIVAGLLKTLETTVQTVGGVAQTALQPGGVVSEAVRTVGGVAQTALQPGGVVSEAVRTVGGVATTALQPGGVVSEALQTVGGVANTALQPGGVVSGLVGVVGNTLQNLTGQGGLLSIQGINALGQTVLRTVDATGRVLERTVDQAGSIVGENVVGNVLELPLLGQTRGATGQLVRTVQDVSGALIAVTLDAAGHIVATDVLRSAGRIVGEAAGDVELPRAAPGRTGRGGVPAVAGITGAVGNVVGAVPGAAANLLQQLVLSSSLTREGRTVQRVVELTGSIVERLVDPATGKVLGRKELGNALRLPLVQEQMDPSGSLIRVVRDATGALIELTFAPNGTLGRLRLLQLGSGGPPAGGAGPGPVGARPAPITPSPAPAPIGPTALTTWLIGQVVDSLGGTVQRVVDVGGKIVERTVDGTGRVLGEREVGNLLKLPLVSETQRPDGRVVRTVRDTAGTLLEVILGAGGQIELVRTVTSTPPGTK